MIQLLLAISSLGLILWIFHSHKRRYASKQAVKWINRETAPAKEKDLEGAVHSTQSGPVDYSEANRAYRIADMNFSRGNMEEAERWFIKVLAVNENHAEVLNKLGVIYIQRKNPRRAEMLYRKLLSITQKEPAYYCNYGRCLYNQGRFDEAIEAYENAIKLDCTKSARFISIGQIYYELKDNVKALSYFVKALELEPANLEYLALTAKMAQAVGDADRLQRSLLKIEEIDPYNEIVKKTAPAAVVQGTGVNKTESAQTFIQTDSPQ